MSYQVRTGKTMDATLDTKSNIFCKMGDIYQLLHMGHSEESIILNRVEHLEKMEADDKRHRLAQGQAMWSTACQEVLHQSAWWERSLERDETLSSLTTVPAPPDDCEEEES